MQLGQDYFTYKTTNNFVDWGTRPFLLLLVLSNFGNMFYTFGKGSDKKSSSFNDRATKRGGGVRP